MKEFLVTHADTVLESKGIKYNVQMLIDGVYAGHGKYCKTLDEVKDFINQNK